MLDNFNFDNMTIVEREGIMVHFVMMMPFVLEATIYDQSVLYACLVMKPICVSYCVSYMCIG